MQVKHNAVSPFLSLNRIEVSYHNLVFNYQYLSSLNTKIKIAPVLKSNAYGHGLKTVAPILDKLNPPFLCVYSLDEAIELEKAGVTSNILIFGHVDPINLLKKRLNFSFAVHSKEFLETIHTFQPHAGVHIFVDTGMHREGIQLKELPDLLRFAKSLPGLKIEGLMSHLGWADKPGHMHTELQVTRFKKAQEIVKEFGFNPKWIHIANSSGMLNNKKYKDSLGNMSRCGLATYGIDPESKNDNLKPSLSLMSTLTQIKKLPKGGRVGYNFTFTAEKEMTIGILPIGYYDGIDRRLSNKGIVYIDSTPCPIIGRVSMNMTTIDISSVKNPKAGQKVVVFSSNRKHENSVEKIADVCKTISYELLAPLATTIDRIVV